MPSVQKVLREVLKGIVPPKGVPKEISGFVASLNSRAKELNIEARAVLGGSFAKGTHLVGDFDVDVFVVFDRKYDDGVLSDLLERILKSFKPVRVHGSRDYFQIRDGVLFEVIPVRGIRGPEDARNVTDFSPFHVEWVKKAGKGLVDDIRLVKKFCKAQGVYGAESYRQGFSGHVIDILTICHGGFSGLFRAVAKWKAKVVVDPLNVYRGRALQVMNQSKIQGPLVVVDPRQPGRNAAAALNLENFERFVGGVKKFLKSPRADFFVEKGVDGKVLERRGVVVAVEIVPLEGSENVVGSKMVKVRDFLVSRLVDFGVREVVFDWKGEGVARVFFVLSKSVLPAHVEVVGPPVKMAEHVSAFKRLHSKTAVKRGRVVAVESRPARRPGEVLSSACADVYVRERVRSCKVV